MSESSHAVFEATLTYPDPDAKRRYASLVGIEEHKQRLEKGLKLILKPDLLDAWSKTHHKVVLPIVGIFRRRPPVFILAGDVGTGKTALAESIGDAVSRAEGVDISLFRLSLASRGSGLVGEMTQLVAHAFSEFAATANKAKGRDGRARGGYLLLIDEADALAQSRESSSMHHEDRVGVNALIRGIDDLTARGLPAAVLLCTNRMSAIDPAVRRRAADILVFDRPSPTQRHRVLSEGLADVGFTSSQIDQLVQATGDGEGRVRFTYSDLVQRYLPTLVLQSFPDKPLAFEQALQLATALTATPRFIDGAQ